MPTEGVRILGAEEAQAALGRDARARRRCADRGRDRRGRARAGPHDPPIAPPVPTGSPTKGPTWSATAPDEPVIEDEPSGEVPPLPHWTEPPTGAVPAIFADDGRARRRARSVGERRRRQPRFRAEGSDWADADFAEDALTDAHDTRRCARRGEHRRRGRIVRTRSRGTPAPHAAWRAARTMVTAPPAAAATEPAAPPTRRAPSAPSDNDAGDHRPSGPTSGRDLPTAIATAAVVAVVALICFTQGTFWTVVLAAAIVGLGTLEFTAGLQARASARRRSLALVGAVLLPIAATQVRHRLRIPVFFGLMVVFSLLWFLWEITPGPAAPRCRDAPCSRSRTSAVSAGSRACCSRRRTVSDSSSVSRCA